VGGRYRVPRARLEELTGGPISWPPTPKRRKHVDALPEHRARSFVERDRSSDGAERSSRRSDGAAAGVAIGADDFISVCFVRVDRLVRPSRVEPSA
jgi:hypothetical protein